jgi:hypothetical protein
MFERGGLFRITEILVYTVTPFKAFLTSTCGHLSNAASPILSKAATNLVNLTCP